MESGQTTIPQHWQPEAVTAVAHLFEQDSISTCYTALRYSKLLRHCAKKSVSSLLIAFLETSVEHGRILSLLVHDVYL